MVYLFEDYGLDPDRRELYRGTSPISVEPKVFDLLAYVIRNRERVVSKDDLVAAIWNGRIVSESALTTCINAARTAIGDSGEAQRLIKTLPRKGIRFVGLVREEEVKPAAVVPIEAALEPSPPSVALPDKPSIAVLPFQNLSGDPEQEYFADGMAEDIIAALSKLRWFFVIARNSSFAYKGKSPDVRQVARKLGVRYVLEGSVRKAGNRLRIAAQLVDATTGNHIWAEHYDREIADIFAVQDEITQSVVATIEPQLYAAENLRIQGKPPESFDAWGCVIRALWHLARITKDDIDQARQLLKRAIALSPGYAKAHSLLVWAELLAVGRGSSDMETALPLAVHHAHTALGLDDTDPWTYFGMALVEQYRSQYGEAIAAYRRAIALNPNFALAHGWVAGALAYDGQPDAALEAVTLAMRMSPQDPFNSSYLYFAAVAHYSSERYAEAVEYAQRALRERPNMLTARRLLAACYVALDRLDDARGIISEVLRLQPSSSIKRDAYGYSVYARSRDQERYVEGLRKAGLPE